MGDEEDSHVIANPFVAEMEQHAGKIDRRFLGVPCKVANRDMDSAFRIAPIRPDACSILATVFPVGDLERECDMIFMRRVLPYGGMVRQGIAKKYRP